MGDLMGAPPPPRGLDKPLSVMVLVAEITPVPLGTELVSWKVEAEKFLQGPASHLKGTRSENIR